MSFKVKTIPKFDKNLKNLLKKNPSLKTENVEPITSLKGVPEQGMPIGKDCYKIYPAIASTEKGKSDGERSITNMAISNTSAIIAMDISLFPEFQKIIP